MTQIFADSIVRKIQLALLAGLSLLCISCSTPVVTNTRGEESTASWAYQQCIASLSRYQSAATCNQIGVTNGSSYADYTYGSQYQYVNDYQQTDSIFRKSGVSAQAYADYVDALPQATQDQMRAQWLELAQAADAAGARAAVEQRDQVQ